MILIWTFILGWLTGGLAYVSRQAYLVDGTDTSFYVSSVLAGLSIACWAVFIGRLGWIVGCAIGNWIAEWMEARAKT